MAARGKYIPSAFPFRFYRPYGIEPFYGRSGAVHAMALVQMERSFFRFLESGLDTCFFLAENENLHGNRRYGFCQLVHMGAAIDFLEPYMQVMTEMMEDIQTDKLLVAGMDVFAVSLKWNIIKGDVCVHHGALCIDCQSHPEIVQGPFGRNRDGCQQ